MTKQGFSLQSIKNHCKKTKLLNNENYCTKSSKNTKNILEAKNESKNINQELSNKESQKEEILKLLSWNIDGISNQNLTKRAKHIIMYLKQLQPDVIHFQEMTYDFLELFQCNQYITSNFDIIKPDDSKSIYYFCLTLISNRFTITSSNYHSFNDSSMARGLIRVDLMLHNQPMIFINTHLESCLESKSKRINQLKYCIKLIKDHCDNDPKCIAFLAGDLNIRDSELQQFSQDVMIKNDCWILAGRNRFHQYTWDAKQNTNIELSCKPHLRPSLRFDRIYFFKKDLDHQNLTKIKLEDFVLCGRSYLENSTYFVSDHWAPMAVFQIKSHF